MTPEIVELLQRTKAAVLANPEHFNMDYWYASSDDPDIFGPDDLIEIEGGDKVPQTPLLGMLGACGTVACAAGWIVALSGEKVNPGEYIAHAGARLIDFKGDIETEPCPLFHTSYWPYRLLTAYDGATAAEDRAKVFAKAVDLWIESDGVPGAFSNAR